MGPLAQIEAFVLTSILGILAGFLFDYYQAVIRGIRIKRLPQYFLDVSVWIFMILIIGLALLLINQAEVRAYVFIALLAGAIIYFRYLSRFIRQPVDLLGKATAGSLRSLWRLVSKPFKQMLSWLTRKYQQRMLPPEEIDQ
ncbi:MAG: spore cortex biosynthesis protein YabQ [Syntrophomonadaceae bacterium]